MADQRSRKLASLRAASVLHPDPDRVSDPLFHDHPTFFDANDLLQVRYEMLRAHLLDHHRVVALCRRYGLSRQSFYTVQARFEAAGTAPSPDSHPIHPQTRAARDLPAPPTWWNAARLAWTSARACSAGRGRFF